MTSGAESLYLNGGANLETDGHRDDGQSQDVWQREDARRAVPPSPTGSPLGPVAWGEGTPVTSWAPARDSSGEPLWAQSLTRHRQSDRMDTRVRSLGGASPYGCSRLTRAHRRTPRRWRRPQTNLGQRRPAPPSPRRRLCRGLCLRMNAPSGLPPRGLRGSRRPRPPPPPVSVAETAAIYADPRFQQMTDRMEKGEWPAVMPLLQTLQKQYAGAPLWEPLLNEAQLRLSLTAAWEGKIKGRRLSVPQARMVRRAFPYLLLSILVLCGWLFYSAFVAPSRATVAMSRANQALVAAARDQFQSSQFADAMYLYDRVLQSEPDNQTALQGRADAKQQLSLATWYDLALQVAQTGNVRRALVMLATIQQESPTFPTMWMRRSNACRG